jgi:hypothetical protein
MGIRKDALDVANARKFEKGEDFKFNPNVDPRLAFFMQSYPEMPNSAMAMIQMQQQDAEAMTGVKTFNEGISSRALGDSVGGIRSALDAASKREVGILRRLAQGLKEIGFFLQFGFNLFLILFPRHVKDFVQGEAQIFRQFLGEFFHSQEKVPLGVNLLFNSVQNLGHF